MSDSVVAVVATSVFVASALAAVLYSQYKKKAVNKVTKRQEQLVKSSWDEAIKLAGHQGVGDLVFKRLFEVAPGAVALFPKFDDIKDLYTSVL